MDGQIEALSAVMQVLLWFGELLADLHFSSHLRYESEPIACHDKTSENSKISRDVNKKRGIKAKTTGPFATRLVLQVSNELC